MGLLTPCFVPGGGFFYTMIVSGGGGGVAPFKSCPRGMALDEIDTCIKKLTSINQSEKMPGSEFDISENFHCSFCNDRGLGNRPALNQPK